MITVTRLDNSKFVVNALLIEFLEATPDTVISMTNGKKIIVKESLEEIIDMTEKYLKKINSFNLGRLESKLTLDEPSEESDEWI